MSREHIGLILLDALGAAQDRELAAASQCFFVMPGLVPGINVFRVR
jgi:hypothetical protein